MAVGGATMTPVATPAVGARPIEDLRARFRGALLQPGEEGYDEARRVWNGAIDRRPALIARCAGADDVVEALRFARERDLAISVRGGGHAVAGHAVCDPPPAVSSGASSTAPRNRSDWRRRAGSSATPGSAG
jgi:hypothetical protein